LGGDREEGGPGMRPWVKREISDRVF